MNVNEEIERVASVRDAIGPAMHLRLDANEAWHLEEAIAILSRCVPYDIQYVEQPLQAHDLVGMCTLRQAIPIPLAVDEAVYNQESAYLVLDSEAADILVIKPQLAGGLHVGQQIIQAAIERGIRSVITSTFEAGIGLTAELHLAAASPAVTLECGLATLHLLVDDLLIGDLPIRDGFLAVPTGPGLGVELDRQALDQYAVYSRVDPLRSTWSGRVVGLTLAVNLVPVPGPPCIVGSIPCGRPGAGPPCIVGLTLAVNLVPVPPCIVGLTLAVNLVPVPGPPCTVGLTLAVNLVPVPGPPCIVGLTLAVNLVPVPVRHV